MSRSNLSPAQPVGARVADVRDRDRALADERDGHRRAHARALLVRARDLVDALVGLLDDLGQPLLGARSSASSRLAQRLDGDPRGDLAGLRAAHAVGDAVERGARVERVLVGPPLPTRVRAVELLGDPQHQPWKRKWESPIRMRSPGVQRLRAAQQLVVEVGPVRRPQVLEDDGAALPFDARVLRGARTGPRARPRRRRGRASRRCRRRSARRSRGRGPARRRAPRRGGRRRRPRCGCRWRRAAARPRRAAGRRARAQVLQRAADDPEQEEVQDGEEAELEGDGDRLERHARLLQHEPDVGGARARAGRRTRAARSRSILRPFTFTPFVDPRSQHLPAAAPVGQQLGVAARDVGVGERRRRSRGCGRAPRRSGRPTMRLPSARTIALPVGAGRAARRGPCSGGRRSSRPSCGRARPARAPACAASSDARTIRAWMPNSPRLSASSVLKVTCGREHERELLAPRVLEQVGAELVADLVLDAPRSACGRPARARRRTRSGRRCARPRPSCAGPSPWPAHGRARPGGPPTGTPGRTSPRRGRRSCSRGS